MDDLPYTTPDEDPFYVQPLRLPFDDSQRCGTPTHPFLAYPDFPHRTTQDDASTLYNYDLVDDDDIPEPTQAPIKTLFSSSTLRNLNLSFGDGPSSPRVSLFTRSSRQPTTTPAHNRSAMTSSKWRPSILGHFTQSSSLSFDPSYTPPRPSLSSEDTTTLSSDLPPTPTKPSFIDSMRTKNRSSLSIFRSQNSASSIWSHPQEETDSFDCSSQAQATLPRRIPFAAKSVNQYDNLLDDLDDYVPPPPKRESACGSIGFGQNGTFSRVSFGTRHQKKKKKLVISGVGVHETRKFEGVKRWCESFGEIRQITRAPNGDLHIEFRKAEVADTVCRVRAKVFIAGVGSVYLSWITGDKR